MLDSGEEKDERSGVDLGPKMDDIVEGGRTGKILENTANKGKFRSYCAPCPRLQAGLMGMFRSNV